MKSAIDFDPVSQDKLNDENDDGFEFESQSSDDDSNSDGEKADDDYLPRSRADTFVGTVNYQAPEVIKGNPHTLSIDIWALGNIMFKMLVGTVAFPGQNPAQVYSDICERKIQWPRPEILSQMMSKDAVNLINALIQIDP